MSETIFSIGFVIALFVLLGFIIMKWNKKISQKNVAGLTVKDPDKFGCH
ncbi:MAG: hypothetical protein HND52_17610 [Ignavibacteriae bacterium]|nr:hypothetical protein [Ignavibacteriota bacterium]